MVTEDNNKKLTKQEQKRIEAEFYQVQKHWHENNDKKSWDRMFEIMLNAITVSIKKKLMNVKRTDIDELALDATCQVMARFQKNPNYNVDRLLCASHYASLGILYNEKQKFYDRQASLEDLLLYRQDSVFSIDNDDEWEDRLVAKIDEDLGLN